MKQLLAIVSVCLVVLILVLLFLYFNRRHKKQLHTNMPDAVQENKLEETRRRLRV
jgi:preprotein translocase subunit YajC